MDKPVDPLDKLVDKLVDKPVDPLDKPVNKPVNPMDNPVNLLHIWNMQRYKNLVKLKSFYVFVASTLTYIIYIIYISFILWICVFDESNIYSRPACCEMDEAHEVIWDCNLEIDFEIYKGPALYPRR